MTWLTAVVATLAIVAVWDMVRRVATAVGTRKLQAEFDQLRGHVEQHVQQLRTELAETRAPVRLEELEQKAAHLSLLVEARRDRPQRTARLGGL